MKEKHEKREHIARFHHANLYYATMITSIIFAIFFIVQGIRFHVQDEIYFALGFYAIFVMLTVISVSCWKRGKGHYHYHAHIENKNLGNKNI